MLLRRNPKEHARRVNTANHDKTDEKNALVAHGNNYTLKMRATAALGFTLGT